MNVILSTRKNIDFPRGFEHCEMYPPHGAEINNLILILHNSYELENCFSRICFVRFKKLFIIINNSNNSKIDCEILIKSKIPYNFNNGNLFMITNDYSIYQAYKEIQKNMNRTHNLMHDILIPSSVIIIMLIFYMGGYYLILDKALSDTEKMHEISLLHIISIMKNDTNKLITNVEKYKQEITSYINTKFTKLDSNLMDINNNFIYHSNKINHDIFGFNDNVKKYIDSYIAKLSQKMVCTVIN